MLFALLHYLLIFSYFIYLFIFMELPMPLVVLLSVGCIVLLAILTHYLSMKRQHTRARVRRSLRASMRHTVDTGKYVAWRLGHSAVYLVLNAARRFWGLGAWTWRLSTWLLRPPNLRPEGRSEPPQLPPLKQADPPPALHPPAPVHHAHHHPPRRNSRRSHHWPHAPGVKSHQAGLSHPSDKRGTMAVSAADASELSSPSSRASPALSEVSTQDHEPHQEPDHEPHHEPDYEPDRDHDSPPVYQEPERDLVPEPVSNLARRLSYHDQAVPVYNELVQVHDGHYLESSRTIEHGHEVAFLSASDSHIVPEFLKENEPPVSKRYQTPPPPGFESLSTLTSPPSELESWSTDASPTEASHPAPVHVEAPVPSPRPEEHHPVDDEPGSPSPEGSLAPLPSFMSVKVSTHERRRSWESASQRYRSYQQPYMSYLERTHSEQYPFLSKPGLPRSEPERIAHALHARSLQSTPDPFAYVQSEVPEARSGPAASSPASRTSPPRLLSAIDVLSAPRCLRPASTLTTKSSASTASQAAAASAVPRRTSSMGPARHGSNGSGRRTSHHRDRLYSPFISGLDIELHHVYGSEGELSPTLSSHSEVPASSWHVHQQAYPSPWPSRAGPYSSMDLGPYAAASAWQSASAFTRTSTGAHDRVRPSSASPAPMPRSEDLNRHFSLFERNQFTSVA